MSCREPQYGGDRAPSTGMDGEPEARPRRSVPSMFFTLTALAFGVAALILFIFAFRAVFAGRIGNAVIFGVLALLMAGAAGTTAVAA